MHVITRQFYFPIRDQDLDVEILFSCSTIGADGQPIIEFEDVRFLGGGAPPARISLEAEEWLREEGHDLAAEIVLSGYKEAE